MLLETWEKTSRLDPGMPDAGRVCFPSSLNTVTRLSLSGSNVTTVTQMYVYVVTSSVSALFLFEVKLKAVVSVLCLHFVRVCIVFNSQ